MALIDDTGFDGFEVGPLSESWRMDPGSPVSLTNLRHDEIGLALASAERHRLRKRRNLSRAVFAERAGQWDSDTITRICRALFM